MKENPITLDEILAKELKNDEFRFAFDEPQISQITQINSSSPSSLAVSSAESAANVQILSLDCASSAWANERRRRSRENRGSLVQSSLNVENKNGVADLCDQFFHRQPAAVIALGIPRRSGVYRR